MDREAFGFHGQRLCLVVPRGRIDGLLDADHLLRTGLREASRERCQDERRKRASRQENGFQKVLGRKDGLERNKRHGASLMRFYGARRH